MVAIDSGAKTKPSTILWQYMPLKLLLSAYTNVSHFFVRTDCPSCHKDPSWGRTLVCYANTFPQFTIVNCLKNFMFVLHLIKPRTFAYLLNLTVKYPQKSICTQASALASCCGGEFFPYICLLLLILASQFMHRKRNAQQIQQQQTKFYFASSHGRSSFARIGACPIMIKAANNLSNR